MSLLGASNLISFSFLSQNVFFFSGQGHRRWSYSGKPVTVTINFMTQHQDEGEGEARSWRKNLGWQNLEKKILLPANDRDGEIFLMNKFCRNVAAAIFCEKIPKNHFFANPIFLSFSFFFFFFFAPKNRQQSSFCRKCQTQFCQLFLLENSSFVNLALTHKHSKWHQIEQLWYFFIYFRLFKHTLQFLQQINVKKSIQYTVPGFELTTFGTRVSSHNH